MVSETYAFYSIASPNKLLESIKQRRARSIQIACSLDMTSAPLTQVAEQLLDVCKVLDEYGARNGLPPASFDVETFVDLPMEAEQLRKRIVDLSQDLKRLAQGPRDLIYELGNQFNDLASLRYVYLHGIPLHVPVDGAISYSELAAASRTEERMLRRMLHMAMINRLFTETPDGTVRHTAASRILHEEAGAMDAMGFFLDELFPAAAKMAESFAKYPGSGEPNETAFNVAFNTSRPFYLELEAQQARAQRFGGAMRWLTQGGRYDDQLIMRGYDWAQFDHTECTFVDVGGGRGAVSRALADHTKNIRIIVQDLPVCAVQGEQALSDTLRTRISYMGHDFFDPQPIKGAEIYFMRYILHNWSDKYARRILQALVPALKHGSRILLCEFLLPDASETRWSEKQPYNMDIISALNWNSVERTTDDWGRLFRSADARFKFQGVTWLPRGACALVEAIFEESATTNGTGD